MSKHANGDALPLAVVFILSRRCNLQCLYCNVEAGPKAPSTQLSLAGLESWVRAFASLAPARLDIQLHGGEPLIVDPPVELYAAVARNAAAEYPGSSVGLIALQTNGLDVHPARLERLERSRIGVTVSVDGPQEIHDRNRVSGNGKPSFESTMAALHALRERGRGRGVISVIDSPTNVEPAHAFFVEQGIRVARMNPIRPQGRGQLFGPLREAAFMREMADAYFLMAKKIVTHNAAHPERAFYEDNIATFVRALNDDAPLGDDTRSWTLVVDEAGELWAHPSCVGMPRLRLVGAGEDPARGLRAALGLSEDASSGEVRTAFAALHQRLFGSCEGCPSPGYCASYVGHSKLAGAGDPLCTFRRTLVEKLQGLLNENPAAARLLVPPPAPPPPSAVAEDATATDAAPEEELTPTARAILDAIVVDDDGAEFIEGYARWAETLIAERRAGMATFRQLAGLATDFEDADCFWIAAALDELASIGLEAQGRRIPRQRAAPELVSAGPGV